MYQILLAFALCAVCLVIERLYNRRWGRNPRETAFNVAHYPFAVGVAALVVPPLAAWLGPLALARIHPHGGGCNASPLTILGYVLALDFFYYWFHRLMHAPGWLWKIHALHHSDPHLNSTTTIRVHWLESPIRYLMVFLPLALLCPGIEVGLIATVLLIGWMFFLHLDVPLSFGRFNAVLSSPFWHRVHHSVDREHFDRNFALLFPIWDIVFGTYVNPRVSTEIRTGVADHVPNWQSALWLYRWPRARRGAPHEGGAVEAPPLESDRN